MSVQQTLKAGRAVALKDVEKARKAHQKLAAKAAQFNKEFEASKAALAKAESELKALDTALAGMGGAPAEKTEAPAKRKYTRRVPVVTKKTAAKAAAKKTTTAAKKVAVKKSRQATGRRAVAEGKRPTLKAAMMQVMGNKVMSKQQVHDGLKAKGWLPNSNDTLGYIGYMLSATKVRVDPNDTTSAEVHLFERDKAKGRGFYRVRQEGTAKAEPKAEAKKAEPKAKRKYTKRAKVETKAEAKPKRKYTKRAKPEAKPEAKASESNGASKEKTADDILKEANLDPAAPFGG